MRPTVTERADARVRGYAICTTQRSGSNYLCQLLGSTGVLGDPQDYFNAAGRREKGWHDYPDDPEQQLETILEHGSSANGVYGFKVFAQHLDALVPTRWLHRLPDLRWAHLYRQDLVGQAISLVIAKQTGRWRSGAEAAGEPVYDAQAIRRELADLARDDARWRQFFALHGLRPLAMPYDALVIDPQGAVRAVAALMGIASPLRIDPSRVRVGVQRDELSAQWRDRFARDAAEPAPADTVETLEPNAPPARVSFPAVVNRRPRLTVSIITRDGTARLPRLLDEASHYADEILVGVDAASTDDTLEAAAAGADVVYRFRLPLRSQLAPARMLPFRYATGDWILTLDDDESMEASFDALVPELLRARGGATHYYFPRKWIVGDDPWEYVHAAPWFPNWAPRLFRNDASLVWKPARPHTMYHVLGPGYHEARTSILHYEPLWCTPQQRGDKLEAYRSAGAAESSENFYAIPAGAERRPVTPRPVVARARRPAGVVHRAVQDLVASELLPWRSEIVGVDMPGIARAGETLVVHATVRNTGTLAWAPTYAQPPAELWPLIRLGYHLLDADGQPVDWDPAYRALLARFVAPGETTTFIDHLTAPKAPGEYVLEWDMLSEGSAWFASCGGTVYRSRLSVSGAGFSSNGSNRGESVPDSSVGRAADC